MTAADAEAAAEIAALSLSDPWSKDGFCDAILQENTICLTAECGGRAAGYAVAYLAADEGDLSSIAVHPDFRKQGIADSLLEVLEAEAGKRGICSIYLEVRLTNLPAQHLYEKHGFTSCGIRRGFYSHPTEDAMVMCKRENSGTGLA